MAAILQLKLKNLKTGSITLNRVRPQDKVEVAFLEKKDFQYLYQEGDDYVFMDSETFDQYPLPKDLLGDQMKYLKENDNVKLTIYEGQTARHGVARHGRTESDRDEPSLKGATAAAQYKSATLETGLKISVPPFIAIGDVLLHRHAAPASTSAGRNDPWRTPLWSR